MLSRPAARGCTNCPIQQILTQCGSLAIEQKPTLPTKKSVEARLSADDWNVAAVTPLRRGKPPPATREVSARRDGADTADSTKVTCP